MSILQVTPDSLGQVGVAPRRVKIVSTDNLATVSAAGYLNGYNLMGNAILPSDVIDLIYSYSTVTGSGTYSVFLPSYSAAGILTISPDVSEGNVTLPVVDGDFAIFSGTTGLITDEGYAPSNATYSTVVMTDEISVLGTIPAYNDTGGSIGEGYVVSSELGDAIVMMGGASVVSHYPKFSDIHGTLADSGAGIIANTTSSYAGGGTSNAFAATGLTSSSIVTATIKTSTNAVSLLKAVPTTNTLTVTFSADPGGSTTVNYVALSAAV